MRTTGPHVGYSPALHGDVMRQRLGADAWRITTSTTEPEDPWGVRYIVRADFNVDGRASLFVGRAAERANHNGPDEDGQLRIIEPVIAGNLASFYAALAALYRAASYHGHVDIGFSVTGVRGGITSRRGRGPWFDGEPYAADSYPRTAQVAAGELDDPEGLLRPMLGPFVQATTMRDDYDPFEPI